MNSSEQSDTPALTLNDRSPVFQAERVAFTGTLASLTHEHACRIVEELGGESMRHISRQTTMLVVGQEGWPLEDDGQPSQKLVQAETLNANGLSIRILSESDWLQLCGLNDAATRVQVCTPAMLSKRLNLPVNLIRRWERIGLIRPVRRVFRLPYFDFQEVNNARRLSQLLENGADVENLEAALTRVGRFSTDADRSLTQLNILVQDKRVVLRDTAGLLNPATGQRLLDFGTDDASAATSSASEGEEENISSVSSIPISSAESAESKAEQDVRHAWTAARWFSEGQRFADEGLTRDAIEAFRLSLSAINSDRERDSEPHPAEVSFALAEALYRAGKPFAAVERYYSATEYDGEYVEAWTQLGCLLLELEQPTDAIHAFQIALDVHADYVDVHWHLAAALAEIGDTESAQQHCREYLAREHHGPWADHARQLLEQPE